MKYYQLLILGNGFDLHCGLKSSYKDFFRNAVLDTISAPFGVKQMKVGVSGFWETLLFEYYQAYGELDYSWCDIENLIKNTLLRILFIDPASSICIWKNALESVKWRRHYHEAIKDFKDSITRYLYKYCMQFFHSVFAQTKSSSNNDFFNLLILNLREELYKFESRFCKYIKDRIVNPKNDKELNVKYITNAMNLLNKMTGFSNKKYSDLNDIIARQEETCYQQIASGIYQPTLKENHALSSEFSNLHSTNILSFNYTALFDILEVKSPCIYSNVHGKLCNMHCEENCNASSVIFGIDDNFVQSKNEYADLRLFSKTYRKMFDTNAPVSVLPIIDKNAAITIKFYGHSLSEADYSYFQSIFDYYNLYSNDHIALVFYYSIGYEQTDAIYQLINSYGKTLSNQEQGKNLIHKLLLENRLKIIEIE